MRAYLAAFAVLSLTSPALTWAGVPMDSFNSINAGLNPALAVNRRAEATSTNRGPTRALVLMAEKNRKSLNGEPPQTAKQPGNIGEPTK